MQVHHYLGPRLAALEENLSQTDYIPCGNGKKKGFNKHRKPPSKLAIYRDQFYEPQTDGCMGEVRSKQDEELAPYCRELADLDVEIEDDQDETEIDADDCSPWLD